MSLSTLKATASLLSGPAASLPSIDGDALTLTTLPLLATKSLVARNPDQPSPTTPSTSLVSTSTTQSSYVHETAPVGIGYSSFTTKGFPAAYKCNFGCGVGVGASITLGCAAILGLFCFLMLRRRSPVENDEMERIRFRLLAGDMRVQQTFVDLLRQPSIQLHRLSRTISKISPLTPTFHFNRDQGDRNVEEDEIPLARLRSITQNNSSDKESSAEDICQSPTWERKEKGKGKALSRAPPSQTLQVPGNQRPQAGPSRDTSTQTNYTASAFSGNQSHRPRTPSRQPPTTFGAILSDGGALGRTPVRNVTRFADTVTYGGGGMPRTGFNTGRGGRGGNRPSVQQRGPHYVEYVPAPEQMRVNDGGAGPSGLKRVYQ